MALFEKIKDKGEKNRIAEKVTNGKLAIQGYGIITEVHVRKADYDEETMQVQARVAYFLDESDTHTTEGREFASALRHEEFIFRLPKELVLSESLFGTLYEEVERLKLSEVEGTDANKL